MVRRDDFAVALQRHDGQWKCLRPPVTQLLMNRIALSPRLARVLLRHHQHSYTRVLTRLEQQPLPGAEVRPVQH